MWLRYPATSALYAATDAKASAASFWRVSGETDPSPFNSATIWS